MLGLAAAVGSAILTLPAWWRANSSEERPRVAQETHDADVSDGGATALGDTAPLVSAATTTPPASPVGLGLDMPKRPFTGQRLAPCDRDIEVEIELIPGKKDTRSCWVKLDVHAERCKTKGYEYKGGCYLPSYPPPKLPQSVWP